ncbi:hypothetical protein OAN307_c21860 [Octadecabacter antarcticus 307]|uniref:Uncharacterized protein n=1 Tax=Octadecabacter antarcticus 307 TaxID=391626 RepID=M9R6G5_9RHOB|nr:hypothetical protein [Octadecabacter antarcticus]AGI67817.1 hypothetical protein OAN307_c21860 [Octadecabacter antarcticus 307]
MQDKTIYNALLALYHTKSARDFVAESVVRWGIVAPERMHDRPLSHGKCKRIVLALPPCTTSAIAREILRELPDITRRSAIHRTYMALLRLESKGVVVGALGRMVVCEGWLWTVASQPTSDMNTLKYRLY